MINNDDKWREFVMILSTALVVVIIIAVLVLIGVSVSEEIKDGEVRRYREKVQCERYYNDSTK